MYKKAKEESDIAGKSLRKFKELLPEKVKFRIRFSLNNLKLDGDMLNVSLFMADHSSKLIGAALEEYLYFYAIP